MPSRPLFPDRHAITQLHARIDVEPIAVTTGETIEELGKHVDLSTLIEDTAGGVEEPTSLERGDGPA